MIQCKSIEESRSALLRNALLLSSPVVVSQKPSVALVLYYRQLVLVVASRQPNPTDSRDSINGQGAQNYKFPTATVRSTGSKHCRILKNYNVITM